jgi:hypothetical protein
METTICVFARAPRRWFSRVICPPFAARGSPSPVGLLPDLLGLLVVDRPPFVRGFSEHSLASWIDGCRREVCQPISCRANLCLAASPPRCGFDKAEVVSLLDRRTDRAPRYPELFELRVGSHQKPVFKAGVCHMLKLKKFEKSGAVG